MKVNWLISNGLVFDGTLSDHYKADIGISSDKILFVDKKSRAKADSIIDAKNLAVAPGFIDTHAHSEFTLLADPRAEGKV